VPAHPLTGDRGSSLMLMPAAVLVVLVLGAIAADLSHVHNRKRELIAVANSIANDAATRGIDVERLRAGTGREAPFSPAMIGPRLDDSVRRSVEVHRGPDRPIDVDASYEVGTDGRTIRVTLRERVDYIFAKAIPGAPDSIEISATGSAVAEED
jgi:hypothetical protein